MKNFEKYISFMVSLLSLMLLAAVVIYATVTSELSMLGAATLLLVTGIGFGTAIYYGYDVDVKEKSSEPVKDFVKDYALHEGRKSYEDAKRLSEEIEENR